MLERVKERLDEVKEDLLGLADKRSQLRYFVELGSDLADLPEELRVEQYEVPGCIAKVHVVTELDEEGGLKFFGDSESMIVKGYLVLLFEAFAGLPASVLLEAKVAVEAFISEAGLNQSMIASRANSFGNVFKKMVEQAEALVS